MPSLTKFWIVRHFVGNYLKGPFFLVSLVFNGEDVTQRLLCDILKDSCKGNYALQNPTSTQFPFHVQKQSKTIQKTTVNWEIGPYLVYLHAVDIINHLHLALLSKNKTNTSCKKKEENNFTWSTKSLSGLCQVLLGLLLIFTSEPPSTKSFQS